MQNHDCEKSNICALNLEQIEKLSKINNPLIIKQLIESISEYSSDAFVIINTTSDHDKIREILDQIKEDEITKLNEICDKKDLIVAKEILNRIHSKIIHEFKLFPA